MTAERYLQVDAQGASFLEGYEAVRPLGEAERSWLPLFTAMRRFFALGVPAVHADTWGKSALWEGEIAAMIEGLRADLEQLR